MHIKKILFFLMIVTMQFFAYAMYSKVQMHDASHDQLGAMLETNARVRMAAACTTVTFMIATYATGYLPYIGQEDILRGSLFAGGFIALPILTFYDSVKAHLTYRLFLINNVLDVDDE